MQSKEKKENTAKKEESSDKKAKTTEKPKPSEKKKESPSASKEPAGASSGQPIKTESTTAQEKAFVSASTDPHKMFIYGELIHTKIK